MKKRIVFGVMSATQSVDLVNQLAKLLSPNTVVVHHDFRKLADYRPTAANVELVPDPRDTGWGTWGFSDAIFHTLRYALDRYDFDYFQLLSPTCLPLRPIQEFEAFVATDPADVHADQIAVDCDNDIFMNFGYRTFASFPSLKFKLLRKLRSWYLREDTDFIQAHSLAIFRHPDPDRGRRLNPIERCTLWLTRQATRGWLSSHPFNETFRPMIGGTFFGARRNVCEHLVAIWERGEIPEYLKHLMIVDETLFASLIGNSGFRVGDSNHAINDFNREGHPRWIDQGDLDRLTTTGRFFGRKFPDDPDAPIRHEQLKRLDAMTAVGRKIEIV